MTGDVRAQQEELRRLAAERRAVILAHNYQRPEVQDAADFVGDSLELARKAAATDAAGHPLLRRPLHGRDGAHPGAGQDGAHAGPRAGCPMANMATAEGVRALKAQHPGRRSWSPT